MARNTDRNLTVAIDARPLSHPQSGGFRSFLRQMAIGFCERARDGVEDIDVLWYVDRPLSETALAQLPPGARVRILSPSRLKTDFGLFQKQLRADRPDIVHGTMNYLPPGIPRGVKTSQTLYDAFGLRRYFWEAGIKRDARQWALNRYFSTMTKVSVPSTDLLVTISHGAASELSEALGRPASDFRVVYPGVALPKPCPGTVRDPNSALVISGPDARKNVEAIWRAFSEHANEFGEGGPPRLDVVCTTPKTAARAQDDLARHGITNFRLLTGLSDQALSDAMARAALFLWPSRREGFGIPPVEAMQAGCAVVSSNALPMPEVLGDAPVYFDPEKPVELARAAASLLRDPADRARRGALGQARASVYTCRRATDELVDCWKALAESKS